MKTGPKALRVHGVPWQTYDYKSYEESLELKLHLVSKQRTKKANRQQKNPTKPLQWDPRSHSWSSASHTPHQEPRDTLTGACGGWCLLLFSSTVPTKCLFPFPPHHSHLQMSCRSHTCSRLGTARCSAQQLLRSKSWEAAAEGRLTGLGQNTA